ncbi:MAG: Gfo/Idh/MocA family oxidoreductase [Ardenticatenaceae bacterium]|nr:Gfo/Idh/MocA family oxidoreductase [Ardenticatenaceae bacterium]HBY95152.1 gfo/Idh/MocA family oxidoreductase [Chloroflexota bacterium]
MTGVKERIRVAIIGTGFGRRVQIPAFQASPRASVVAICSRTPAHAEQTARDYGMPRSYTDYAAMLDAEAPDLVSIVTPPDLHADMAVQALERGIHVLCEKPMALDTRQAERMLRAAERSAKVHAIDHELRFNPNRRKIKELLAGGHLGRPYQAVLTYFSDFHADPRIGWDWWSDSVRGGGALGAVGSHEIDLLEWWFGPIEAVSADLYAAIQERPGPAGSPLPVTSDDTLALLIRHRSGTSSQVLISNVAWGPRRETTWILCEQGSLELQGHDRLLLFEPDDPGGHDISQPDALDLPPRLEDRAPPRAFVRLADHLCTVIADGVAQEGATFEDGLRTQWVMDAVQVAAAGRCWVQVEQAAAS